jgi:hypothetical protein
MVNKGLFLLPPCFLPQFPNSLAKVHPQCCLQHTADFPASTAGSPLPGYSSSGHQGPLKQGRAQGEKITAFPCSEAVRGTKAPQA